jgi:Gas vesicle synthesis protein GvpL/GvpF
VIYLYGIVARAEGCCDQVTGIHGAPLQRFDYGWIEAIGSQHDQLAVEPTDDALWAHERVVETLASSGAVLPARFGVTFAEEAALGRAVAARSDRLIALLGRVRGRLELALRARELQPGALRTPSPAPSDGRGYLEQRRQHGDQLTPLGHHIYQQLADLAAESTGPSWRHGWLTAAYLVDMEKLDVVRRSSRSLAGSRGIQLALTGPWPPYSFVGID